MKKMFLIGVAVASLTACDKSDATINQDVATVQAVVAANMENSRVLTRPGDVVLKVVATDELTAIAAKEKNAKFYGTGEYLPETVQDGYCLINITELQDYRILCGVPENYDDPYAVALKIEQ